MEEIQRKLRLLNYPRANAPAQALLFTGMERYAFLEWLFLRLFGDKSPFSQKVQLEMVWIAMKRLPESNVSWSIILTHFDFNSIACLIGYYSIRFGRDCKVSEYYDYHRY